MVRSAATFGPVRFEGLQDVSPDSLQSLIAWREGEPVDSTLIDQTSGNLQGTGLFDDVEVTLQPITADGPAPVVIKLNEGPPRTVSFAPSLPRNAAGKLVRAELRKGA